MKNFIGLTYYFDTAADATAFIARNGLPGNPGNVVTAALVTAAATPAIAATAAAAGSDELGNPTGTTYWWNAAHETVFKITPTDPPSSMTERSQQITPAQFKSTQEALAKKFAHLHAPTQAGAAASPAPASAPAAAAQAFDPLAGGSDVTGDPFAAAAQTPAVFDLNAALAQTPEKVDGPMLMAKFKELDAAKGRQAMMAVLDEYGVQTIPGLVKSAKWKAGEERVVYAKVLVALK
jgi:hypothetical protein